MAAEVKSQEKQTKEFENFIKLNSDLENKFCEMTKELESEDNDVTWIITTIVFLEQMVLISKKQCVFISDLLNSSDEDGQEIIEKNKYYKDFLISFLLEMFEKYRNCRESIAFVNKCLKNIFSLSYLLQKHNNQIMSDEALIAIKTPYNTFIKAITSFSDNLEEYPAFTIEKIELQFIRDTEKFLVEFKTVTSLPTYNEMEKQIKNLRTAANNALKKLDPHKKYNEKEIKSISEELEKPTIALLAYYDSIHPLLLYKNSERFFSVIDVLANTVLNFTYQGNHFFKTEKGLECKAIIDLASLKNFINDIFKPVLFCKIGIENSQSFLLEEAEKNYKILRRERFSITSQLSTAELSNIQEQAKQLRAQIDNLDNFMPKLKKGVDRKLFTEITSKLFDFLHKQLAKISTLACELQKSNIEKSEIPQSRRASASMFCTPEEALTIYASHKRCPTLDAVLFVDECSPETISDIITKLNENLSRLETRFLQQDTRFLQQQEEKQEKLSARVDVLTSFDISPSQASKIALASINKQEQQLSFIGVTLTPDEEDTISLLLLELSQQSQLQFSAIEQQNHVHTPPPSPVPPSSAHSPSEEKSSTPPAAARPAAAPAAALNKIGVFGTSIGPKFPKENKPSSCILS